MTKLPAFLTAAAFAAVAIAARADGPRDGHDHDHGPAAGQPAAEQKEKIEELLVAAQKICPVTGMPLDAMGGPYRAKSGERTVFLCCKSCLGKPVKSDAWKQIQRNMAEAQGVCPVMNEPLPKNPASVVVEGRTVFICCKPCIKKVQKDPAKALAVVDAQLKKHVEAEKVEAEKAEAK